MKLQAIANKQKLRSEARAIRKSIMSSEAGKKASLAIQKRLIGRGEWRQAENIILYYAVYSEVGTSLLLENALLSGKTLFLPRCEKYGIMQMRLYAPCLDLEISLYGIPEPPLTARTAAKEELQGGENTLIVVPGLAFDKHGMRLGAGGGYYDRFLQETRCTTVGLTFDSLFVEKLPSDQWDIPVNAVCTEKEFFIIS